jgi:hypothetical protein
MRKFLVLVAIIVAFGATAYALQRHRGEHVFSDKLTVPSGSTISIAGGVTMSGTGGITLANSESLNTDTDATFDFTRNNAGAVTLTSSDNDATAAMTVDPGGNATLTLGSAADTVTIAATSGLTLENSESLNAGTDATFDFTRNDAGTVTLTASDNDATAALTVQSGGAAALGLDAGGAAAVNIGNTNATSVSICNAAACDTVTIGSNADADTITIGDATDTTVSITDDNWSVTAAGIATFPHVRRTNGAALSAADVNLTKANIQAASWWSVDTSANAVDVDFGDDAALDAQDIGSKKVFHVTTGHTTQALTVTAGAAGVTTVTTINAVGTTCEDAGDMIECTVYATTKVTCVTFCAD